MNRLLSFIVTIVGTALLSNSAYADAPWKSSRMVIPRAGCADICKLDRSLGKAYGDPLFYTIDTPKDGRTYSNPRFVGEESTCEFDKPRGLTRTADDSGFVLNIYSRSGVCHFHVEADVK